MKKAKLLIAVLVCAVMMMGVGYAWWTDTITLAGTAKTGNMNVIFTAASVTKASYVTGTTAVDTGDTKKVTFTLENLYPGATATINNTVKNAGTIPVKFDQATVKFYKATYEGWVEFESAPEYLTVTPPTTVDNIGVDGVRAFNIGVAVATDKVVPKKETVKVEVTADWKQFNDTSEQ